LRWRTHEGERFERQWGTYVSHSSCSTIIQNKVHRHQTNAMLPKLVFPLKNVHVPEECVAGGTRVAAGSGSKGTCVTICHPPETWVVVFFPAGFSCIPPKQRVQWYNWVFGFMQSPDCRRLAPLSGEAKHPAGDRPSKWIIIIIMQHDLSWHRSHHKFRVIASYPPMSPIRSGRVFAWTEYGASI
jgi:hypothetical protein